MSKDDRSVLSWLGFAAAIAALAVAIFGLRDDGGGGSSSAAGSEGGSSSRPYITITMNDSYRFTPDTIVIPTAGATLHLVNEGGCSRLEFARAILDEAGRPDYPIDSVDHFPRAAETPGYAPLRNFAAAELGVQLPDWRDALRRFLDAHLGRNG